VLQLLDLARENAALKREFCRIHAEAKALQRLVAAIYAGAESCTPLRLDALLRDMPYSERGG